MIETRLGRLRRSRLLRILPVLAFLSLMIAVSAALFNAGSPAAGLGSNTFGARPGGASVLHLQASRTGLGASDRLEAWLDLTTGEGKIIETGPDGTVRRVVAVANGTYTLHLADRRHVIVRRGFGPTSPHAGRIRNELFGPRMAVEQGRARVVGAGRIGDRTTDRVQFSLEDGTRVIDVDQETGLVLREEMVPSGSPVQIRETAYTTLEYVDRSSLSANAFEVSLPADGGREEYTESDPGNTPPSSDGLIYTVYAAPASVGASTQAFRRFSTVPGGELPPSDSYYVMYRTADGEVSVRSSSPDPATRQGTGGKSAPVRRPQTLDVAGVTWEIEPPPPGQFQASANLGDAYVTIFAPNRAIFERVAAGLRRLNQ